VCDDLIFGEGDSNADGIPGRERALRAALKNELGLAIRESGSHGAVKAVRSELVDADAAGGSRDDCFFVEIGNARSKECDDGKSGIFRTHFFDVV
jgi:hypothetical protein